MEIWRVERWTKDSVSLSNLRDHGTGPRTLRLRLSERFRLCIVQTARDLKAHRASGARRRTSHGQLARNNLSTLQGLNAQPGVTVTVRADAGPPPTRLQRIADQAAQSGNLRSMHPADRAPHANAPWDELRVWDPGD